MVPKLFTRSAFVIPYPVSQMVSVFSSLLGMMTIFNSFSSSRISGSVKLLYLILSRAYNLHTAQLIRAFGSFKKARARFRITHIRRVGDQLSHEYFLVRIECVDDQAHQLSYLGLKREGFRLLVHLYVRYVSRHCHLSK